MKTAEEILYEEMDKGNPLYEGDSIRLMKEYAKEAIKEDRKNIAKHAECMDDGDENFDGDWVEKWVVDKQSIYCAPNIELL